MPSCASATTAACPAPGNFGSVAAMAEAVFPTATVPSSTKARMAFCPIVSPNFSPDAEMPSKVCQVGNGR